MDDRRFDEVARQLARGASRRSILKGLLGIGGAAAVGGAILSHSDARTVGTRPTVPTPKPPVPTPTSTPTPSPTPTPACPGFACGFDCCETEAQCCDGECCPGDVVCLTRVFPEGPFVEEEICCPEAQTCDGRCCEGACFTPLGTVASGFDRTCCTAETRATFCPGEGAFSDVGLCCSDQTPDCCHHPDGRPVCLPVDSCCVNAECAGDGTVCAHCVDFACQPLVCGACEGCLNGECLPCEQAGFACCREDVCRECCRSEDCGPYHDCDLFICLTCEEEGMAPCGEPPCPGNSLNCCCQSCQTDDECDSCEICADGACRECADVGLTCFGGICGECGESADCGPYHDCDLHFCLTCEEEGMVRCGGPPCPDNGADEFNCCCEDCRIHGCDSCEVCGDDGVCRSCDEAGFACCSAGLCRECCQSADCGPFHDCDQFICFTCEEAGMVRCGEPPCPDNGADEFNCCCSVS